MVVHKLQNRCGQTETFKTVPLGHQGGQKSQNQSVNEEPVHLILQTIPVRQAHPELGLAWYDQVEDGLWKQGERERESSLGGQDSERRGSEGGDKIWVLGLTTPSSQAR